ncbi:DUF2147 domain-containing protein [Cetobacterium somerae]|uniref:DUF2147 domain-containing protein n=1 Tax=Cetobacterium sp. NK01 TaxID=2993530 RepID=UPI0021171AF4|nr:DUF2147 domain-containing protein [Cetobacterium sp. NK01]MCQ8212018.1 DUF2147 domain-containing protein [Cetobacterium sp. NK01]
MRIILMFIILGNVLFANSILGYWMTQEGKTGKEAIVLVEKIGETYNGKIKYIATVDKKFNIISYTNKDEIIGFELVKDFKKVDDNIYKNGRVIDPKSSREYYASVKLEGDKFLLRGSLDPHGILGARRVWKKVDKEYIKKYGDEKL